MADFAVETLRPCICATFWGLDFAQPHQLQCLCGEVLQTYPSEAGWCVQHGPNPEHRSPDYPDGSLLAVCDWIDSVCLGQREPASGRG